MPAKPIALANARKAKALTLAQLESMRQLLGAILLRHGPMNFHVDELETMDPRRLVIVNIRDRWIVGLKDTGDQPLELTALSNRALQAVSEPEAEVTSEPG